MKVQAPTDSEFDVWYSFLSQHAGKAEDPNAFDDEDNDDEEDYDY